LIVEDEGRMARLLRQGLEEEGYAVVLASDGPEGLQIARSHAFDVIVLDVMLPGMDGLGVTRQLRAEDCRTPILMLTARDTLPDIVRGLDIGADDYLTKPFSFEVLLARLRALVRRGPVSQPVCPGIADLSLNPATRTVSRGGRPVNLTRTEFNLLELLLRRAGTVVPRDTLIDAVWGFGGDVESNTLDAFVRLLRSKIEAPGETKLLHTVRGVGYCLREPE
jgi:DNA-binding response OmpR family regulator